MSEPWEGKHYSFFTNRACEFFPCHKGADPESFNCLFCYCPLYPLGETCGGNPSWIDTETGRIKDCSGCLYPHKKENYGRITARFSEIAASGKILVLLTMKLNQKGFSPSDCEALLRRFSLLKEMEKRTYTDYYEANRSVFENA